MAMYVLSLESSREIPRGGELLRCHISSTNMLRSAAILAERLMSYLLCCRGNRNVRCRDEILDLRPEVPPRRRCTGSILAQRQVQILRRDDRYVNLLIMEVALRRGSVQAAMALLEYFRILVALGRPGRSVLPIGGSSGSRSMAHACRCLRGRCCMADHEGGSGFLMYTSIIYSSKSTAEGAAWRDLGR
jgi:hypothetical protein